MNKAKPVFIVDAMLGNVAKKLRLLGFDSIYSPNIEDNELLHIAKNENRIIITKDETLSKKAKKKQIQTIQVTKTDEIEQFIQINRKINLGKCIVSGSNSRCPICNGNLISIEKNMYQIRYQMEFYKKQMIFGNVQNARRFTGKELILKTYKNLLLS